MNGLVMGIRKGKTLNDLYQESIKATNRRKFGRTNRRGQAIAYPLFFLVDSLKEVTGMHKPDYG